MPAGDPVARHARDHGSVLGAEVIVGLRGRRRGRQIDVRVDSAPAAGGSPAPAPGRPADAGRAVGLGPVATRASPPGFDLAAAPRSRLTQPVRPQRRRGRARRPPDRPPPGDAAAPPRSHAAMKAACRGCSRCSRSSRPGGCWSGRAGVGPLAGVKPATRGDGPARDDRALPPGDPRRVLGPPRGTSRDRCQATSSGARTSRLGPRRDDRPRSTSGRKDARTRASVSSRGAGPHAGHRHLLGRALVPHRASTRPVDQGARSGRRVGRSAFDANPLTLVDRLRSCLATPGPTPGALEVACGSASGRCRPDPARGGHRPGALLAVAAARDGAAVLPTWRRRSRWTRTRTLRPAQLAVDILASDGTVDLRLAVETRPAGTSRSRSTSRRRA